MVPAQNICDSLFSGSLGVRCLGLKIFIPCVNYALLFIQNGKFEKCRKPY